MDVMHGCVAGLDVHKETVAACVRRVVPGGRFKKEVRTFGTTTRELLRLSDWLSQEGVEGVAMESTGVFWKPVWNVLEGTQTLLLANARHIKNVPGRKTDVKDCEWIAQLLQHGLLQGSFVPDRPQRELRDLTRHRAQLTAEATRAANRVQKVLEDANVKLSSVASDVLGVSGRLILRALINGCTDVGAMAEMAKNRLRKKLPELREALEGHLTEHHRFMLAQLMDHLEYLERQVEQFDRRIEELMVPFQEAVRRLTTIPGIKQRTAENVLAEIGTDMGRFPSAQHLSSWAGICPGNRESAGKHQSGRTRMGNRWLRMTLTQAAWAGSRTKDTYLSSQYRRLAGRRGKKRAIFAVAHTILVIAYHCLRDQKDYRELGSEYLDQLQPKRLTRYLVKRLESLGHTVLLVDKEPAA